MPDKGVDKKDAAGEAHNGVDGVVKPPAANGLGGDLNSRYDVEYKLPVTGDRTATWRSSAFHNVTAMVGAGVLGLPSAMSYLGWPGGIIVLVLSWVISLYTLWQLCVLHEIDGKRFNRYHELAQHAFGRTLGNWILLPPQLIVLVGLGITYTVTGGQSLHAAWQLLCQEPCRPFGLSAWIVVFSGVQLILSQCPNFNALTMVSLAAAVMSITYSTIAFGASVAHGQVPDVQYNLDGYTLPNGLFGVWNALGTVAFAYGGHNVVLEIQATLPSPPSTKRPMMKGVLVAYSVVAWCYSTVSIAGYWAFGNSVKGNILLSIGTPVGLIAAADLFVVIHVLGSYQVYTMPVFDMIEHQMVRHGIRNDGPIRVAYRCAYVVLIAFVACSIPFFGDLMGFVGALGTGPTTFWIPSLIYLVLKRPSVRSWHFWASWTILILCVIVTLLGSIGAMRGIITAASGFHFYE
ncbi:hypothetical protein CVIRNUC_004892 [Coccomyxa viridis]|uniref:Amino acid transporter transmembrane domain-containing protein n=1 Tax=Coccomyxa viridis TaxID=1274662 RepID=A0AAV1I708_9CHLO|nr:hypothetical protein CVIRNUC_004892 [Coccomyxa viridis]